MLTKKYNYIVPLAAISACILFLCTKTERSFLGAESGALNNSNLVALCAPFKNVSVEYRDNTGLKPDSLFADSFFAEAANGLLTFEAKQRYRLCPKKTEASDSMETLERGRYSPLNGDTAFGSATSERISRLAQKYSVDLVIVPYSCVIKQRTQSGTGWRKASGPGYDRPVSFSATATVHIQIWNASGRLLYERIGTSQTGKPLLYSLLKKEKTGNDIVKFAKKMFAPPLVKALYMSIKRATRMTP
jgi:hypothetical protein